MTIRVRRLLMTTDAVGGVWTYALDLARSLADQGVETLLAVLGPSPSASQKQLAASVPGLKLADTGEQVEWLADSASSVRASGEAVARLADRHKVDLIQLNTPALAAETRFTVPTVAVNHSCVASWWRTVKRGVPDMDFAWRAALTRRGLQAAHRVVAPSRAFAEMTRDVHSLRSLPTSVHNGRAPLTGRPTASHDFVFTAGRLWDEGKNVATLDAAAAELCVPFYAAGPTVGPNGSRAALSNLCELGNLTSQELGHWLSARPVFASSALYEPFGLTVLEAALAECPLVLSDIPTFRELWDGVAVFVDAQDVGGFAKAIDSIAGDDLIKREMGLAARQRGELYTPESMGTAMLDIYRQVCAGSGASTVAA